MQQISGLSSANKIYFNANTQKVSNVRMPNLESDYDTFEKNVEQKDDLTIKQKQQIIKKARTNASGVGIFLNVIAPFYYYLRSDETIAKKFDLDSQKDKELINKIRKQQTLWTLPSMVPGFGVFSGLLIWHYNKTKDPDKIKV